MFIFNENIQFYEKENLETEYQTLDFWSSYFSNFKMLNVVFSDANQGLICSLSNRGEQVSMFRFKEIYFRLIFFLFRHMGVLK